MPSKPVGMQKRESGPAAPGPGWAGRFALAAALGSAGLWGQAPEPTKEYIYLGGRLIAIESRLVFGINPTSASYAGGGGTGAISVTAPTGAAWSATTSDQWVHITSGSSGSGSGEVRYSVDVNVSGAARTGTIRVNNLDFQVTQSALSGQAPSWGAVNRTLVNGTTWTFSFTASSANGHGYIKTVAMAFSWAIEDLSRACYLMYEEADNRLYVSADSGADWLASGQVGSATWIANSQCSVSLEGTSVTRTGNDLEIQVPVIFSTSFIGPLRSYMKVEDDTPLPDGPLSSGWSPEPGLGTWTAYAANPAGPVAVSATPSQPSGTEATFSYVASSQNGHGYLAKLQYLLNGPLVHTSACEFLYYPGSGKVWILSDDGGWWMPQDGDLNGIQLGASDIQNWACKLKAGSSASPLGNNLTTNLIVEFLWWNYAGKKHLWLKADDRAWNSTQWLNLGNFAIPEPPKYGGVSVISDNGATKTFSFTSSSWNGYGYIQTVEMAFNWSIEDLGNACYLKYDQNSNTLFVSDNSGTSWPYYGLVGSGAPIGNNQCSVDPQNTIVSGTGNDLEIQVPVTFASTFIGPLRSYMKVDDDRVPSQSSGWSPEPGFGTWTPFPAQYSAAPVAYSVSPTSGSGTGQTFTWVASSVNGFKYIPKVQYLLNRPQVHTNACDLLYYPGSNRVFIQSDQATWWMPSGGIALGSGDIQNAVCRLNGTGSSKTLSGNNVTANLSVTFFPWDYAGDKDLWMKVDDRAQNSSGWVDKGNYTVTGAPQISNVQATGITATTATITWTTNEGATTQAYYGTTTSYGSQTALNSSLVTSHSAALTGLAASTTYHYKVASADADGNTTESSDRTFTTAGAACTISSTSYTAPNGESNYSVQVTCPAGTAWTASNNGTSWVTVSPTSGTGPGSVVVTVANANGGAGRSATATIAGRSFAITQLGPSAVVIEPSGASLHHDEWMQFHAKVNGVDSDCQVVWTMASGLGTVLSGTAPCGKYTAPSIVPPGQGTAVVRAFDPVGNGSATATVTLFEFAPPDSLTVSPDSGSALTETFTYVVTDAHGGEAINQVQILYNTSASGVNGCYLLVRPGGEAPLVNTVQLGVNNGTGWTEGPVSLGTAGKTLENSQCKVNVAGSAVSRSGNTATITIPLTFKPGFTGVKNIYMQAQNTSGAPTEWIDMGDWNLSANPAALAPAVSLTAPAAGATVSGTVTISGWALDNTTRSENVITAVEILVDDVSRGYATLGQASTICTTYPNRPGCPNVGWVFYWSSTGVSNGTHTIKAKATDYDNPAHNTTTSARTVTVNNAAATPVVVSPASPYVPMTSQTTSTQQFTATVGGTPSTAVDWTLTALTVSPLHTGTISTAGLYTAPSYWDVFAGDQLSVKATRQANPSDWGQTTLTLMGWLSPATMALNGGQAMWLYSSLGNVTWSLSPALGSITQQGYYVAPSSGYTPGTVVTVTATDVGNPIRKQVAKVTLW